MAGGNNYGQLGIEEVKNALFRPTLVPVQQLILIIIFHFQNYNKNYQKFFRGIKISVVSCGSDHTFAMTSKELNSFFFAIIHFKPFFKPSFIR